MGRRLRPIAITLAGAAVVAALALFGLASNGPASGRPAPALPSERLAGPPVTLSSLLAGTGGRPAVVVFWASWCGPCEHEAAALERFANGAVGRGRIVGVDWSDGLGGARRFITRYRWTFPNVRDSEGTVGSKYHLTGLPTSFVVDAHGRIRTLLQGPQDEASLTRALSAVEHA
jgi:thiol-disulfide isomerase/thioredoxin